MFQVTIHHHDKDWRRGDLEDKFFEICAEMEALAEEHIGRENIVYMPEPSLGADDFAFFTQMCDGLYMNVGTNNGKEEHPQNIHNEWYNPDEEAMKNGMLMEVLGALKLLAK